MRFLKKIVLEFILTYKTNSKFKIIFKQSLHYKIINILQFFKTLKSKKIILSTLNIQYEALKKV